MRSPERLSSYDWSYCISMNTKPRTSFKRPPVLLTPSSQNRLALPWAMKLTPKMGKGYVSPISKFQPLVPLFLMLRVISPREVGGKCGGDGRTSVSGYQNCPSCLLEPLILIFHFLGISRAPFGDVRYEDGVKMYGRHSI